MQQLYDLGKCGVRIAAAKWIDESGIVTAASPSHQLISVDYKILSFSFIMIFLWVKKPHTDSKYCDTTH